VLLFCPYRKQSDLTVDMSFTAKFREAVREGTIGETEQTFLQNVQNAKSNSFRMSRIEDDLQRHTECFVPADDAFDNTPDDDEEEDTYLQGKELEQILNMLDDEAGLFDTAESSSSGELPKSFNIQPVRQKGKLRCGYDHIAKLKCDNDSTSAPLVELDHSTVNDEAQPQEESLAEDHKNNPTPSKQDIVRVMFEKTS